MTLFNRKKPTSAPGGGGPVMRGRHDEKASLAKDNPLARRLVSDEEPDTIDLDGAAGFPASAGASPDEPETRRAQQGEEHAAPVVENGRFAFLTQDPVTGKFYVQPGTEDCPVFLGDERVLASTELRRGDRLRIGQAEFEFLL